MAVQTWSADREDVVEQQKENATPSRSENRSSISKLLDQSVAKNREGSNASFDMSNEAGRKNANDAWILANQMANEEMSGGTRLGRLEYQDLVNSYYDKITGQNGAGQHLRDNNSDVLHGANNLLTMADTVPGFIVDDILVDGIVGNLVGLFNKDAGDSVKNFMTREEAGNLATNVGLSMIPGAGIPLMLAKNAIQSEDEIRNAITGKDSWSGMDLTEDEKSANALSAAMNIGLSAVPLLGTAGQAGKNAILKSVGRTPKTSGLVDPSVAKRPYTADALKEHAMGKASKSKTGGVVDDTVKGRFLDSLEEKGIVRSALNAVHGGKAPYLGETDGEKIAKTIGEKIAKGEKITNDELEYFSQFGKKAWITKPKAVEEVAEEGAKKTGAIKKATKNTSNAAKNTVKNAGKGAASQMLLGGGVGAVSGLAGSGGDPDSMMKGGIEGALLGMISPKIAARRRGVGGRLTGPTRGDTMKGVALGGAAAGASNSASAYNNKEASEKDISSILTALNVLFNK